MRSTTSCKMACRSVMLVVLQSGTDACAEGGEVRQTPRGPGACSSRRRRCCSCCCSGRTTLLGQGVAALGEFLEADDLSLIRLQQAAVGPVQPIQAGLASVARWRLLPAPQPRCFQRRTARTVTSSWAGSLSRPATWFQTACLQGVSLDASPWALGLAAGCEGIGPGAPVVAPAGPAAVSGKIAAVKAQPADPALK